MTLQLLHSKFPYIWGKFDFLFYKCTHCQKKIITMHRKWTTRVTSLPGRMTVMSSLMRSQTQTRPIWAGLSNFTNYFWFFRNALKHVGPLLGLINNRTFLQKKFWYTKTCETWSDHFNILLVSMLWLAKNLSFSCCLKCKLKQIKSFFIVLTDYKYYIMLQMDFT